MTKSEMNQILGYIKFFVGQFYSPNECDSNLEAANMVDGLFAISRSIDRLAETISKVGTAERR